MISGDEKQDSRCEEGYISVGEIDMSLLQAEQRQKQSFAKALRGLNAADQAYAGFLKAGMNQKQAAQRSDESAVTARKREERIRVALQAAGYGAASLEMVA